MRWDIFHRTHYLYSAPASDSFSDVRLEPLSGVTQTVETFSLRVSPAANVSRHADFYGNWTHHIEVLDEHLYLVIESQARVRTHPLPELPLDATPCPIEKLESVRWIEYCHDFLQSSHYVSLEPDVPKLAAEATAGQADVWLSVLAVMRFVHGLLKCDRDTGRVRRRIQDVMARRRGTHQDFAHLMIGLCRALKIPARYVSGYLAGKPDTSAHAWVEVYIPTVGWIGLDPVHDSQTGAAYIKVAVGRDSADVPSVTGHNRGARNRKTEVDIRIEEVAPARPEER